MTKILIVDDDQTMVKLLRTLLEMDGYEVFQIGLGSAVLAGIGTEQPDVVLMDIHLADANGLEILGTIRADANLSQQKVIMTSGLDMKIECVEQGANAFIQKPYTPDQLSAIINQTLS